MTRWDVEPRDNYDDLRRAWISGHHGWSTIQRRRTEQLGRRIRVRQRAVATAVPDPHDDTVIPPLWLRTAKSPAAQLELFAVLVLVVAVPLGWLGGWLVKLSVVRLIPRTLSAYPIAAFTWSGVIVGGAIVACYDPGSSPDQIVLVPWVCVQVAAAPTIAGLYGVLDGWLAVPRSDQWWPLEPPRASLTATDAVHILGGYDTTGPGLLHARRLNSLGERSAP